MKRYTKLALEKRYRCVVTDQDFGVNVYRTVKPEPGYPGLEFSFIYGENTAEVYDVQAPGFMYDDSLGGFDMGSPFYEDVIESLLAGRYEYRMSKLLFIMLIDMFIQTTHHGEVPVSCGGRDVKKLYKQNKLNVGAYEKRQI